jgi:phosphohistidine phosphatase
MHLYVMRHGPAEDRAASGRDSDRVLTPAGRAVVARAAALLAAHHQGPALRILVSPLQRAQETAALVAAHLGAPEPATHDDLGMDFGVPQGLALRLHAAGADALLVGHQPAVEALVRRLLEPAALPLPAGGFRTATIVALEAHGEGFRLALVLDPYA